MSTQPSYRCEELPGDILAVSLRPDLNETDWTEIERVGSEILDRVRACDRPRTIVDLTSMNHMGSSLVALIVRIWKVVGERSGEFVVVNDNDLVGEVMEIAGLAEKWTIVSTRQQAVAILGGSGAASAGPGAGVAWLIASALVLVLGGLAITDAIVGGLAATAIGVVPLLEIVAIVGILGVLAAGTAAWRGSDAIQLLSVFVITLSGVLFITAVLLIVNRAAWMEGEGKPKRVHQVNHTLPTNLGEPRV